MKIKIDMPRGDYRPYRFKIPNLKIDSLDEIYMTFKKNSKTKDFFFQKRLSRGEITKDEEGFYHFAIMPEDTDNLGYGEYFFDIEVYNEDPLIKQTTTGVLKLTDEATFSSNEGEESAQGNEG